MGNGANDSKTFNANDAVGDVYWTASVRQGSGSATITAGDTGGPSNSHTVSWTGGTNGTVIEVTATDSRDQACCEGDYAGFCTATESFTLMVGCELTVTSIVEVDGINNVDVPFTIDGGAIKMISGFTGPGSNIRAINKRIITGKKTKGCNVSVSSNDCNVFADGREVPAIWSSRTYSLEYTKEGEDWTLTINPANLPLESAPYQLNAVRAMTLKFWPAAGPPFSYPILGIHWSFLAPGAICCKSGNSGDHWC